MPLPPGRRPTSSASTASARRGGARARRILCHRRLARHHHRRHRRRPAQGTHRQRPRVCPAWPQLRSTAPTALGLLLTDDLIVAYRVHFAVSVFLVVLARRRGKHRQRSGNARMRAVASAFYLLMATVGLAVGPYAVGEMSGRPDRRWPSARRSAKNQPAGIGGAARHSRRVPGVCCGGVWCRRRTNRLERARAAGEPVEEGAA